MGSVKRNGEVIQNNFLRGIVGFRNIVQQRPGGGNLGPIVGGPAGQAVFVAIHDLRPSEVVADGHGKIGIGADGIIEVELLGSRFAVAERCLHRIRINGKLILPEQFPVIG